MPASKRAETRIGRALRELHRDDVAHLERTFIEAVAAAKEHGATADVTVKLKIRPTTKGETEVSANCTSKLPTRKPRAVTFFFTEEGNDITREDPAQGDMFPEQEEKQDAPPAAAPSNISPMPIQKAG